MRYQLRNRLLVGVAAGALVFAVGSRAAIADEAPVNSGNFSFTFENDFTNAYFFRGILQERDGGIWQPSLGLAWKLYSSEDGVVRSASLGLGTWESVHSKHTFSNGNGPKAWYEADVYPSATVTWAGGVTTGFTYYFYTSPNGGFTTTDEADITLGFDDSPYLGAFALHPSATFAFETKGTSFGDFFGINGRGHGKGDAAILAIAPSVPYTIPGCDSYPLTFTFPVSVTLSTHDYYKDATHNDTFGYASVGANFNFPLAFIPKAYGTWSMTNGLNVLFLSDALKDVNHDGPNGSPHGDAVYPVWMSSIIMAY